ncbi:hypothetical protein [Azospirillum sp. TSO35-2]|uniref:hypothetical protein n=1 Tax=Azospirillum sp. TSO35-2 TaxID=716796 RepID=UPI000D621520|nr:hypothetical protein [Azospirillum sp. TSO35-2]PWC36444.1 hypothetical protein TSO352_15225 [Azospirillum sp. TSO35-2]
MSLSPAFRPVTAWVVYRGEAPLWWLRVLKPGFRHCLALLHDGRRWVVVDPLAGFTDIAVLDLPAGFDLPGWYRAQGLTVDAAPLHRPAAAAPWGPFTCVEAVKRLIGLRAPWVLTPWQLHRHLSRRPA